MSTYTKSQLIEMIQELAADLGHPPTIADINERDEYPSQQPFYDSFGSWNNAMEAAGFEPRRKGGAHAYSESELLDILQELGDELGRRPTLADIRQREQCPTKSVFSRVFGSWSEALVAAGYDLEYTVPDQRVNLPEVRDRHGHPTDVRYSPQSRDETFPDALETISLDKSSVTRADEIWATEIAVEGDTGMLTTADQLVIDDTRLRVMRFELVVGERGRDQWVADLESGSETIIVPLRELVDLLEAGQAEVY